MSVEFLTASQACNLLKISRANFYARVRDRRLPAPAIRIGRLTRWSRDQLIEAVISTSEGKGSDHR